MEEGDGKSGFGAEGAAGLDSATANTEVGIGSASEIGAGGDSEDGAGSDSEDGARDASGVVAGDESEAGDGSDSIEPEEEVEAGLDWIELG